MPNNSTNDSMNDSINGSMNDSEAASRHPVYQDLLARLNAVYAREQLRRLFTGALKALSVTAAALLLLTLAEASLRLSSGGRFFLYSLMWLIPLGSAVLFLIVPFVKNAFDADAVARRVGEAFPAVRDRLVNAVQVYRENRAVPNPFADAELRRISQSTGDTDFSKAVRYGDAKKLSALSVSAMALVGLLFIALPNELGVAFKRIANYAQDFTPPLPFEIVSLSKDISIAKGGEAMLSFQVVPRADAPPVDVRKLTLHLVDTTGDLEFQEIKLFADSAGRFQHSLRNQKQSLKYFADSEPVGTRRVVSEKHRLSLTDKPAVAAFQVTIVPPAYTRLPVQRLEENFGDASAITGSRVSIKMQATKPLEAARLLTTDSLVYLFTVKGDSATLSFPLKHDLTYRFDVLDTSGTTGEKSPEYTLRVSPDDAPSISFIEPIERRIDIPQTLKSPLALKLRDDYGYSRLSLFYKTVKSDVAAPDKAFSSLPVPFSASEVEQTVFYTWDLNKLAIASGDELEFYAEVADNDAVAGYKVARTEIYSLRLPTMEELFSDIDKGEKQTEEDLKKTLKESEDLQKKLEQLTNDLRQKPKMDWQDKKQLQDALKKTEALQKQAESASEQMQALTEKMKDNQMVTPETLEKYAELQKLFQELSSPELKDAMKKMQDALERQNEQQIREAMKNFSFNEEQMKKSLERTMEVMKRLQIEKKFDELAKRLDDMVQKQAEAKKETEQTNPDNQKKLDELAKAQRQLQEQQKQFEREMAALEEKMKNFPKAEKMPLSDLDSLRKEQQQDDVAKDMKDAEKELAQREPKEASEKQESASQKMQKQQKQLSEMKQGMQRQKKQEVIEALKGAVQSSLDLSKQQEALRREMQEMMKQGQPPLGSMRDLAAQEQELKQSLRQLQENLSKAGKKTTDVTRQMSKELRDAEAAMMESMAQLENRQAGDQPMQGAMQALNRFADQTADAMAQMMAPGKGKGKGQGEGEGEGEGEGFEEGMKSLADRQGQLNGEAQGMMGEGREQGQSQSERLSQMAAQQRLLQQQLQDLARKQQELQSKQGGGGQKPLGNMDKLAEEMEEAARMMEQQTLSRDLVKRQQQILSRMLESTKSLKQRELEEKREANTGKNLTKRSPAELNLSDRKSKLQESLNRLKGQGYSEEYERLIRRYYEQVEQLEN